MKKLTLLTMACLLTIAGFAAGGNITYELNGGVTNDYGWANKTDMLVAFSADYNVLAGKTTSWGAATKPGEISGATFNVMYEIFDHATLGPKWVWLKDYILKVATEANYKALAELQKGVGGNGYWRGAVDGFFTNSKFAAGAWNEGVDFSTGAALPEAFISTWKHGFAGPAEYDGTADVELPDPYKEGEAFAGWYKTADFSDERVTVIPAGATGNLTFYAKFGEYIPNCKEVGAMAAGTETKVGGIVSFVSGTTAYMQDATAGLMAEFATAPDLKAGDRVTLLGTTAALGAYKKLTAATVVEKNAASMPAMQTLSLAFFTANAKDYMFEYVKMEGLKIIANDGAKIDVTDDGTNNLTINITVDKAAFVAGKLINVTGVVSFTDKVCIVGNAAGVEFSPLAGVDPFTYPSRHEGAYALTNRWLISKNMDNLSANPIGSRNFVRGMLAFGGKMYFVDREKAQLTVIDAETGTKLAPIKLAANIFTYQEENATGVMETKVAGTLPFNDIKMDAAGHVLLGNCITSNLGRFQIWQVDLANGEGKLILDDATFATRFPATNSTGDATPYASLRFDAFGVYGDVENDGYILAADASAEHFRVFKWDIKGGVVTSYPEQGRGNGVIQVDNETDNTPLSTSAAKQLGTAAQVFPISEEFFYVDGFDITPLLVDMDGTVLDGFFPDQVNRTDSVTKPGEKWGMDAQLNGITEFQVGDEYFMLMASSATNGIPPAAFRLFKYQDENRAFKDLECLWTFPAAGMGTEANEYRTAVPYVEVNEATKEATIYLYVGENGYGVYEFRAGRPNSVGEVVNNGAVRVFVDENTLRLSEEVARVSVFSLNGQLIATANNVSSIDVMNNGLYVVKALSRSGETAIHKIIVK